MKELRDRVAVVTGAAGGIGRATARALAAEGMRVVVSDLEADGAEALAEELRASGAEALPVATDVSERDSLEELARRTWEAFGACHLLHNHAGVIVLGPIEERTAQDWEWVLRVNLWGVIHGIQAFVPRMLAMDGAEERHIVNTASVSGLLALPLVGVYATTKYAVVGLSESLRVELAPKGIGVSVLCPGGVQTGILQAERNRPAALGGGRERARGTVRSIAGNAQADAEDSMDPDEVAGAIVEGVRANDAFILTHPRYGEFLDARHAELRAAVEKARARRSRRPQER